MSALEIYLIIQFLILILLFVAIVAVIKYL